MHVIFPNGNIKTSPVKYTPEQIGQLVKKQSNVTLEKAAVSP
jgi:hypothetical protein